MIILRVLAKKAAILGTLGLTAASASGERTTMMQARRPQQRANLRHASYACGAFSDMGELEHLGSPHAALLELLSATTRTFVISPDVASLKRASDSCASEVLCLSFQPRSLCLGDAGWSDPRPCDIDKPDLSVVRQLEQQSLSVTVQQENGSCLFECGRRVSWNCRAPAIDRRRPIPDDGHRLWTSRSWMFSEFLVDPGRNSVPAFSAPIQDRGCEAGTATSRWPRRQQRYDLGEPARRLLAEIASESWVR